MQLEFCSFFVLILCLNLQIFCALPPEESAEILELTDFKWDQLQKGQWLIGFFDEETKESDKLKEDWGIMALKCKEQGIKVAQILPQNPGLHVRFLVTTFPKVFYVRNGVAHEVKKPDRLGLVDLIHNKKWPQLKPVNFLNNPFSIQMSLLSHLFIHAVNLYNFENSLVRQVLPFTSATDIVFALTFIFVGTFLGLLLTCIVSIIQIYLLDSKKNEDDSGDDEDEQVTTPKDNKTDKGTKVAKKDDSDHVRKRK